MATVQRTSGGMAAAEETTASIEQRAAPRYTLLLRQAKLRGRSGEFLCVLRDVSETGLSVRTFHRLPDDDRMAIELAEQRPHLLEKVWEKEGEAGFRFRDPVGLDELLADDARFPRRPFRATIEHAVDIRAAGIETPAQIINLSQQGACIRSDRLLAREQPIVVLASRLPPLDAKVRWRRDDSYGVAFVQSFSFRDFAVLLAKLQGIYR